MFKLKKRLTLTLSGQIGSKIEAIASLTRAVSSTEVIRRALVVYHFLVTQKSQGNEAYIKVRQEDGSIKEEPIFL